MIQTHACRLQLLSQRMSEIASALWPCAGICRSFSRKSQWLTSACMTLRYHPLLMYAYSLGGSMRTHAPVSYTSIAYGIVALRRHLQELQQEVSVAHQRLHDTQVPMIIVTSMLSSLQCTCISAGCLAFNAHAYLHAVCMCMHMYMLHAAKSLDAFATACRSLHFSQSDADN